jgi:FkbM family methyltransferase
MFGFYISLYTSIMENKIEMDFEKFDWGIMGKKMQLIVSQEMSEKHYERVFQVKEGDIVVDIGASVGPFTYSILCKNPKHVFCLEPSRGNFPYLVKNTIGYPVTQINKAITNGNGITDLELDPQYGNEKNFYETTTFNSFIKLFNIDRIDFLKMDIEGDEYHIFTDENIDYLLNNVGCIVGEWHLKLPKEKTLFKEFRDLYLSRFNTVKAYSVDGIDITWDLYNEHFLEYYNEVIIHISNK